MDTHISNPGPPLRRAVFVDRDGTLNLDVHYLSDPQRLEIPQGVARGLRQLRAHGYLIIVATNQSGIARGLYTVADVEAIHRRLQERLQEARAAVDAFYYCPHEPSEQCPCRKPRTGLFLQAQKDFHLDLPLCAIIGDRWMDVEVGRQLGMLTAFVPEPGFRPRYPDEVERARKEADIFTTSFREACWRILARG
jgi:D-glycero-D-manno-heptose 1,7-bisphosphate phosphatase